MADSAPVNDVLCGAIEYLLKLGTNLRQRSEVLRNKRIRKEKLQNTHAVQKATSKVLLLCELSKKSIVNVESTVKAIQAQIERTQTNNSGGNSSTSEKDLRYEYIIYNSKRLKIRKKVDINHYKSAKVSIPAMSATLQERYPVFYDCKLFRLRKRANKLFKESATAVEEDKEIALKCDELLTRRLSEDGEQVKQNGLNIRKTKNVKENIEKSTGIVNSSLTEVPQDNEKDVEQCKESKLSVASIENNTQREDILDSHHNTSAQMIDSSNNLNTEDNERSKSNALLEVQKKNNENENSEKVTNSAKDNCHKDLDIDKKKHKNKDKNRSHVKKGHKISSRTASKNITPPKDSCDEETLNDSECNKEARKCSASLEKQKSSNEISENMCQTPLDGSHEPLGIDKNNLAENCKNANSKKSMKTFKNIIPHNKSSDEETDSREKNSEKKNDSKTKKSIDPDIQNTALSKKINLSNETSHDTNETSGNVTQCESVKVSLVESQAEQRSCESDKSVDSDISKKSYIKCVNIATLLKPDKIKYDSLDNNEKIKIKSSTKDKTKHKYKSSKGKSAKSTCQDNSTIPSVISYVQQQEIKYFKSKICLVNIVRLPKLNVAFLKNNKLKRVYQVSPTTCNVCDPDWLSVCKKDTREALNTYGKRSKKPNITRNDNDMDSIKKTLLDVSDSEKSNEDINAINEKVKNTLLCESDSDKSTHAIGNTNNDTEKSNGEKIKNASNINKKIINDDISTRPNSQIGKDRPVTNLRTDNINEIEANDHSLVNDIRLTTTNCASNKRKRESDEPTSPSNTKKKLESIDAKKILLTNSSSDTEDEQLRNTCKNIQKALLESDSSSDETKTNARVSPPGANKLSIHERKSYNSSCDEAKLILKENDEESSAVANSPKPKHTSKSSSSHREKKDTRRDNSSDTESSSKRKNKKQDENDKRTHCSAKESSESERSTKQKTKDSIKKGKITKKSSSDSESSSKHKDSDRRKKLKKRKKKAESSSDMSQADDSTRSSSTKMGRNKGRSGSSGQVSHNEDSDKDIKGLTNLNSLRKVRRRRRLTNRRSSRKAAKMPKAPAISEEVLLQAESSSDAASVASNDGEVEELPRVPVAGLNGDSIDHLAKDDLLGESDSSSSHNQTQNSQEDKGETDDDNVKRQRRKANAISSDSEAGSSRRKSKRFSDFEDSEDESEPTKKSKRKKKVSDSDSSAGSGDDRKKKRRRIKNVDDSEGSGSETENEGRNKHGRKNIRKVMGKNQLEEATKKAAREEKERIARIAERQKLYNNLQFDESGKPDEVVLDKVVLDFDPETKEPLIEVDKGLVKKLKPHQANGIKFMWDACFESVKRIKKDKGSGCILAHCMGLGKTLQVVSLTHTLLTHNDLTKVNRVLVVCPLSTVLNWVNEFKMWLKHAETDYEVDVYELSRFKQNSDRAFQLQQWFQHGGVCVLGYEMFRNLSSDNTKKFKKKMLKNFQESLVDPGPDLVVCDEGHLLKNEKTSLSQAMNKVKTLRRIVLTGTPLQNNLKEYYCMVQFVKPNLLGKYNEYLNRFVNPITNGQYTDSTEHDIRIMKRRSHVLHKMLDGAVQRRDYGVLAPFLPPKHEYVLFITLSEVQTKLYQHYLDNYSRRPLAGKSSGFLFPDFQSLQRIWTHPLVLKYNSERYEIMQQKKREREEEDSEGSLKDFIDDESTSEESSTEESTDDSSIMSDDSRKKSKKKSLKNNKPRTTKRGTRANPVEAEDDDIQEVVEVKNENPTEWWMPLVSEEELDDIRNSPKLMLLFDILRQCEAIGDKLLVFSQSLYSLDLIEHFLGKVDEATQEGRVDDKLGGHVGSWTPGLDYFRLDGSTSCENRSIWCRNFNRDDNPRSRLFLISTRAGGLGINLVAANRVVIFDVSWNPSHDVQSIFRVYRFGQKKPCYIYRFLAMGTMEEKIYERQVTKQAISKRVIDEQQIDRHYAENDLAELYKFEPTPPQPRPIPPLPKDRLFAEMLKEHEPLIYKYHEHDSLLENKEEETLTEEERKAAWEDFENEKTRPPPVPFTSAYTGMHNGMMPGFLNMQQQTLDYIAMLRKGAPDISDNQIRAMLPLLYNSHPGVFGGYDYGFMQKMNDLYKMQAGMMNPSMMNSGSGGGGSGGMPMGATSGLQYEPPWQRQQQMRLQQVMQQQQSSMGAKFYAGGLGSRDPVAMALQHQRAREMMLGERSGRPRGRPPLAASKPRPPPADIVNLDSD